jgi:hypothetical protein
MSKKKSPDNQLSISRRQFCKSALALTAFASGCSGGGSNSSSGTTSYDDLDLHVIVAQNGTPVENMESALSMAGGIERFIDYDDIVVLKPNGQWPKQGYTNTLSMKALIDIILNRPGGFGGEVIVAEHVHRSPTTAMSDSYCWNISAGDNRENNWPDMSYLELIDEYHNNGAHNVTANPLYDSNQGNWDSVTGPQDLAADRQGWVRSTYTTAASGGTVRLSYPILRSTFSDKLVDLGQSIVWHNGAYTNQQVRLIFLPTLNNHGAFNQEDYAGPTSAIKCHLGIVDFTGASGAVNLHQIGYGNDFPDAVGESIGHLITAILSPTLYITCAEYTGYQGRTTSTAAHTKTVGLCRDPVTLDYWMCKYIMYPIATSQQFMNPDYDSNLRKQLLGCHSKGVGTLDENQMSVTVQS